MAATAVLIDDDPVVRHLVREALRKENIRIVEHEAAGGGVSPLPQELVDLFVVDIIMPPPDGFEVIREIRRSSPAVPLIAYSRHQPLYLGWATRLGADAAVGLHQPSGLGQLVETVRRFAAKGR